MAGGVTESPYWLIYTIVGIAIPLAYIFAKKTILTIIKESARSRHASKTNNEFH